MNIRMMMLAVALCMPCTTEALRAQSPDGQSASGVRVEQSSTLVARNQKQAERTAVAHWSYGSKKYAIHQGVDGVLVHEPPFWLLTNPSPLPSEYPRALQEAYHYPDEGLVVAHFSLLTSSEEVRRRCAEAVKAQNPAVFAESEKTVWGYPIRHVVVGVVDNTNGDVIGTGESDFLTLDEEIFRVRVRFTWQMWQRFLELSRSNQVLFRPRYFYDGQIVESNRETVRVNADIGTKVEEFLRSENLDRSTPIFQNTATKLCTNISMDFRIEAWRQRPGVSMNPVDVSAISALVLNSRTVFLEHLDRQSSETAAIREYLRPLMQWHADTTNTTTALTIGNEESHFNSRTNGSSSGKSKSSSNNWNMNVTVPVYGALVGGGIGGSSSSTRSSSRAKQHKEGETAREILERVYGVTMQKAEGGQVYRPHKIRVYSVKENLQEIKVNSSAVTYFAEDDNVSYALSSPFSLRNTEPETMLRYRKKESSLALEP